MTLIYSMALDDFGATCTTRLPCVDGPPCGDDLPAYVGRCEVQPGSGR
jgi:hypothetical protein